MIQNEQERMAVGKGVQMMKVQVIAFTSLQAN